MHSRTAVRATVLVAAIESGDAGRRGMAGIIGSSTMNTASIVRAVGGEVESRHTGKVQRARWSYLAGVGGGGAAEDGAAAVFRQRVSNSEDGKRLIK